MADLSIGLRVLIREDRDTSGIAECMGVARTTAMRLGHGEGHVHAGYLAGVARRMGVEPWALAYAIEQAPDPAGRDLYQWVLGILRAAQRAAAMLHAAEAARIALLPLQGGPAPDGRSTDSVVAVLVSLTAAVGAGPHTSSTARPSSSGPSSPASCAPAGAAPHARTSNNQASAGCGSARPVACQECGRRDDHYPWCSSGEGEE